MDQKLIFLTMIGMMAVTFIPRVLPFLLLVNKTLPDAVVKWLSYIPSAVLAAMLFPSLLIKDRSLWIDLDNLYLLAFAPTVFVAYKTRSLFLTVITGMIMIAATRYVLGW